MTEYGPEHLPPLAVDGDQQVQRQRRRRERNPDRKRHGARNQDRHKIFVKWLIDTFELPSHAADASPELQNVDAADTMNTPSLSSQQHILDVAGGKGEVSARLTMCHQQRVVLVDPRPANVADCFERLVLPKLPKKWQQRLDEKRQDDPNFVRDVIDSRFQQMVTPFDEASFASSRDLQNAVQNASLLLGLHADGATEAIVDTALKYHKPFVVVPCCVFPNLFQFRTIEEVDHLVQVRSHDQFCRYLLRKDPRFVMTELPFAGRNIAIWWDGK